MDRDIAIYKTVPLRFQDQIPVFSENDGYIDNYEMISVDHTSAMTEEIENPFIPNYIWESMEDTTVDFASHYLPENEKHPIKVLDVGVGVGRLLSKLESKVGCEISLYGVDIALPYLKAARDKNINVTMSKIEDLPYHDNYFDMVTCTDVLEHVFDLNLCVRKIIECIKPSGVLIVRVPNREDLSSYLREDYPYELAHLRNFDEDSLKLLFSKVFQMEILEVKYSVSIPNFSLIKYSLPIKGYKFTIKIILKVVGLFSSRMRKKIIVKMFHYTEINIAFRKK